MKKTTITNTTAHNEFKDCPLAQLKELQIALATAIHSTDTYREALRKAAAAALDNYMSTWETPENPDTFRNHVLGCGPCEALDALDEWALVNQTSLDLLLAEHPYLVEENS